MGQSASWSGPAAPVLLLFDRCSIERSDSVFAERLGTAHNSLDGFALIRPRLEPRGHVRRQPERHGDFRQVTSWPAARFSRAGCSRAAVLLFLSGHFLDFSRGGGLLGDDHGRGRVAVVFDAIDFIGVEHHRDRHRLVSCFV